MKLYFSPIFIPVPYSIKLACVAMLTFFMWQSIAAQPTILLHKPFKDRVKLVDSLFKAEIRNVDSVTAFQKLGVWTEMAKTNGDEELEVEMEYLKLKYYSSGKQTNYPLYEQRMPVFIKQVTDADNMYMRAKAVQELASYYYRIAQHYDKAFDGYLEMYHIVSGLSFEEFPMKQRYLYDYGRAFYFFDDLKNASKYILEAGTYSDSKDYWLQFHINNTLGLIYRKMMSYDSSTMFFEKARLIGIAKNDSLEIAIAQGNMGHNYYMQKQYDKAVPLLEEDVAYSGRYQEWGNGAGALVRLGVISYEKGNTALAEQQVTRALGWLAKSGKDKDFGCLKSAYEYMAKIYASKGQMALAYAYSDSAAAAKDSVDKLLNAQILFNAKRKIEAEQHAAEINNLQSERKMQELIRNSVIVILVLLMVISLLIYNRKRLKHKQEQQLILAQKLLVEQELASATGQLNAFTNSMIEKTELIEHLQQELGEQSSEALQLLQQRTILTDEEWTQFRLLFEKAHTGYLQRLKEKLPELSQAEIRFMALAKLEFTSKQMAATLGITSDAIRMMRYRLRKKLNLTEEDSLEELIGGI